MAGADPIRRIMDVVVPRAVDSIDLDEVIGEIDLDRLLSRVDVNALLDRVDVDALLERVDVNALLDRVDVEHLMARVNIQDILARAQVDAMVRATAGGLGNRLLDLVRRQLVGIDIVLSRLVDRLLHRRVAEPVSQEGTVTGQIAGGASRLAAFVLDLLIESAMYTSTVAVVFYLASLFTGRDVKPSGGSALWQILVFGAMAGVYQWTALVIAGRTVGRAVAGVRVSSPDGSPLTVVAATRRVLVYPFSFVLGLGLVGIVTGRRHRALHDMAAPSLVFYDWGDRQARMPAPITQFFIRQGVPPGVVTAHGDGR
ncbi:MAG TPA: RDD family protein [Acidimicrobiales bacterium]|nr:RDD family protein [Acidimicrobiales bacterium]